MGEDQDPAGARGLDEADRGDRLAGAGRVLEPEAAARPRVLRRLLDHPRGRLGLVPVLRLLVGRHPRSPRRRPRPRRSPLSARRSSLRLGPGRAHCAALAVPALPLDLGDQRGQRPERASTWCRLSSAPSRSWGSSRASARARAAASSRAATRSRGPRAGVELGQRGVERAAARAGGEIPGVSPSSRIGSRVNSLARSRSASLRNARRASGNVGGVGHRKAFGEVPAWAPEGGDERCKLVEAVGAAFPSAGRAPAVHCGSPERYHPEAADELSSSECILHARSRGVVGRPGAWGRGRRQRGEPN